jgi:hypothetical protein
MTQFPKKVCFRVLRVRTSTDGFWRDTIEPGTRSIALESDVNWRNK